MLDSHKQSGAPVRGSNIINGISCNVICSGQNTGKLPQNGLRTMREVTQLHLKILQIYIF